MEGLWGQGISLALRQELQFQWYTNNNDAKYCEATEALLRVRRPEWLPIYRPLLLADPSQLASLLILLPSLLGDPVALDCWCELMRWWRWQSRAWHAAQPGGGVAKMELLCWLQVGALFEVVPSYAAGERLGRLLHEMLLERPALIREVIVDWEMPTAWLPWLVEYTPALHVACELIPQIGNRRRALELLSWLSLKYPLPQTMELAKQALRALYREPVITAAMLQAALRLLEAFPPLVRDFHRLIQRLSRLEGNEKGGSCKLGYGELSRRIERIIKLLDEQPHLYRRLPTCLS